MKTRIVFLFAVFNFFLINGLLGQAPDKMNFQAVIRDSTNNLVKNQMVSLKISVLQGSENGSVVYSEVHSGKTNENGIITLIIGNGTVVGSGVYDNIDLSNGPYFFKREIDPKGGTSYLISGMSQLLSVPYGIYANTADTVLKAPDTSSTNEIQAFTVSMTGDTLYLSSSNYVIIPGISNSNPPIITDIDGNVYNTVQIGNQVWMKQNLKTSKYNDGTPIPQETNNNFWNVLITGAWSYYNNDENYNLFYGKLYNWYAVNTGKLCPTGWHVPSDNDWTILTDYLAGLSVAGGKLKEVGTDYWNSPNEGATDEVGFTALPGGRRLDSGHFSASRRDGYWWSATPNYSSYSWYRRLRYTRAEVSRGGGDNRSGFSVRCLRN